MKNETGRNPDIILLGREQDIERFTDELPKGDKITARLDPNDLRPATVISELQRVEELVIIFGPRGMPYQRQVLLELARVTERGKRVRFVPVPAEVGELAVCPEP
jgi:hypothetical protein